MDLLQYHNDHLIQKALLVLDQYYSFNADLFEKAFNVQLLVTEESSGVYNTVKTMQHHLDLYLSNRPNPSCLESAKAALTSLTKLCYVDNESTEPHAINQVIIINSGMILG